MAFVRQQVLEYGEHKEELKVLGAALARLQVNDQVGAVAVLLARQIALMEAQRPVLKDYNQRDELQGARS